MLRVEVRNTGALGAEKELAGTWLPAGPGLPLKGALEGEE
jgi:hypothetical protein